VKQISPRFLSTLHPGVAVILCAPADSREMQQLRSRYPRLLHVPFFAARIGTPDTGTGGGRITAAVRAGRQAKQAMSRAAQSERESDFLVVTWRR